MPTLNNPPTPPATPTTPAAPSTSSSSTNVASLVNPSTVSTLTQVNDPKSFGEQEAKKEAQRQIAANTSTYIKLEKEKALLIKEGIQLDIDHQRTLFKLDIEHKKYQALHSKEKTNETPTPTPPQLTQSVITAGKPPYKDKASGFGDNQIEIKIIDSNNDVILDYILDPPNTSFNDIQQSIDDVKSQLKEAGDEAEILKNKRYLIHIYGVPEDQQPEPQITKGLSDEEYQIALINENGGVLPDGTYVEGNYPAAKKDLQIRKDKNQKDIDEYKKDRKRKQKERKAKRKAKRAARKARTKAEKRKARKAKAKVILDSAKGAAKGAAKSLVPVLILLLSNKIADVIAQNDKIQKLVDDTNAIITDANESGDPTKLTNAQLARDNAIKIIQSNEDKIIKIKDDINRISIYITIFSLIVSILSSIPIPPSAANLVIPIMKVLNKANRILLVLIAFLPIITSTLEKAIDILEDLKSQLLNINGELESSAANDSNLINNGNGFGTTGEKYKGFRFAIREDNSFGGKSVGGFKRHYAVAIDIYDVEVLKSELSFTLDPNDLIEQLKLVIDNQGLFTGPVPSSNTME